MFNNKEKTLKKSIIALSLIGCFGAATAGGLSVDVDRVKDDKTGAVSQAQYIRVTTQAAGMNVGLQVRTATFDKGGMLNSVELTGGKNFGSVGAFAGVGHDNGFNGKGSYQYGLVGASTGMKLGPAFGYAGVKTRVNWDSANPKQTVAFAGVSMPLNKRLSVNAGMSKSYQDIKESAWGVGLNVKI